MRAKSTVLAAMALAGFALAGIAAAAPMLAPGESAGFNAWVRFVQRRLIRSVTRARGFP